jgi:hypothetical protein
MPLCGHERFQFSNITFKVFLTNNPILWDPTFGPFTNVSMLQMRWQVYYTPPPFSDPVFDQILEGSWWTEFTLPYPALNPEAIWIVSNSGVYGLTWTWTAVFGLRQTRFVPSQVVQSATQRDPIPESVMIDETLVPVIVAKQYLKPYYGSVSTNPLLGDALAFKFVASFCVLNNHTALETFVQPLDANSRVFYYVCNMGDDGNGTAPSNYTNVLYGYGCLHKSAVGGARPVSGAAWSRTVLQQSPDVVEEFRGAVEGAGAYGTLQSFIMSIRVIDANEMDGNEFLLT